MKLSSSWNFWIGEHIKVLENHVFRGHETALPSPYTVPDACLPFVYS